jgi:undecaprenyl-diphosphatase
VQSLPKEYTSFALLITSLGDPLPLIILAITITLWELYRRHYARALVMTGSLIVMPAFYFVKELIQRARPLSEFVAQHGLHDYSFPSGHSAGSMAVYGMILLLASSHLVGKARITIVTVCATIIALIGLTRIYLGAHFPSDVIGGWLLGLTIISLLRSLSLMIAKHRNTSLQKAVEDTTESSIDT